MYSHLDLNSWKTIQRESGSTQARFHIIAGVDAFRIWKLCDPKKKPSLALSMNWRDVSLAEGMFGP